MNGNTSNNSAGTSVQARTSLANRACDNPSTVHSHDLEYIPRDGVLAAELTSGLDLHDPDRVRAPENDLY